MPNEFGSSGGDVPHSGEGRGERGDVAHRARELTPAQLEAIEQEISDRRRAAAEALGLSRDDSQVLEERFNGDLFGWAAWRRKETGSLPGDLGRLLDAERLERPEPSRSERAVAEAMRTLERLEEIRPTEEQLRADRLARLEPEGACRPGDNEGSAMARGLAARAFILLEQTAHDARQTSSRAIAVAHVRRDGSDETWVAVSSNTRARKLEKVLSEGEIFTKAGRHEHAEQALIREFQRRRDANERIELVAIGVSRKICTDRTDGAESCISRISRCIGVDEPATHPLKGK